MVTVGRMRAIAALAALILLLTAAPLAHADTVVVPERPFDESRTVFVDDPLIVDPRPLPIESWSRTARPDTIAVQFSTGVPQCSGVHASVHETAEAVTVELLGGTPPDAVGRMCIMLAVFGTVEVPLQTPLGDRAVLSTTLDKPQ